MNENEMRVALDCVRAKEHNEKVCAEIWGDSTWDQDLNECVCLDMSEWKWSELNLLLILLLLILN